MLKYLARYKGRKTVVYAPYADAAREKAVAYFHLDEDQADDVSVVLHERYAQTKDKRKEVIS